MNKLQRMLQQIHKSGYDISCHFSDYSDSGKMRFYGWLHGHLTGSVIQNYCVYIDSKDLKSFEDIASKALDIICKNQISGKYITA